MVVRNEAPIAAVVAVVAVVSHHQVAARRDLAAESAVIVNAVLPSGERPHAVDVDRRRGGVDGDRMHAVPDSLLEPLRRRIRQALQIAIAAIRLLRPWLAVDADHLVLIDDLVARQADQSLDEVLRGIDRVAKDDDVAALRLPGFDDLLLDDRQPYAVGELVDQDEVADLERRAHRRARNLERLGDERAQQEHDQQDREETFRILDPPRLGLARTASAREDHPVGQRDHSRQHGEQEQN